MMDFNERVIPGVSSNFMFKEALARYEFASDYIKSGMNVLDLGSGTGYGSKLLSQKGAEVLGVDIDKEAVTFAEKHFGSSRVKFKKGDITKIKNPGKKQYDIICSFEVIEHLKSPAAYLQNVGRLLKPDGVFIISTPNVSMSAPGGGVASPYHEKEYKYEELKRLLSKKFGKVEILGQGKSRKAQKAWDDFMKSQKAREGVASSDKLGIRKLIPKGIKEKIWKYFGNFAGRKTQEFLDTRDFPISSKSVRLSYYFLAVCKKPKFR